MADNQQPGSTNSASGSESRGGFGGGGGYVIVAREVVFRASVPGRVIHGGTSTARASLPSEASADQRRLTSISFASSALISAELRSTTGEHATAIGSVRNTVHVLCNRVAPAPSRRKHEPHGAG